MTRFPKKTMKILKEGAVVFLTIALLIWNKISANGWFEWASTFFCGIFIAYGIKSMWDQVEEIVFLRSKFKP